nr:sugar phosphate nucleotidyltransferase [Leptospira chreensis]
MAGGKGIRLRPHTENCPKPLLPVNGKPMLEHIIIKAKKEGFYKFRIAIQYLGHMIEEYFEDGSKFGVEIEYLKEELPLGTAGALSLLPTKDRYSSIVVTNGDVLTDISYSDLLGFHKLQHSDATMAVRLHEWQHPFGVVQMDGLKLVGFEEKPFYRSYVNAGIYVVNHEYLQNISKVDVTDMPTFFFQMLETGKKVIVFPMHEKWLDVGRPEDFEKASKFERRD